MDAYHHATPLSEVLYWDEDNRAFARRTEPFELEDIQPTAHWQFKLDRYDWDDPSFIANNHGPYAYRVIPLTKGYFMIVSPHDYKRMMTFPDGSRKKWYATLQTDPRTGHVIKVYGCRTGRGDEPQSVYAHRELIGCIEDSGVVDHMNGFGLDNRRGTKECPVNLRYTSQSENTHNAVRSRTTNLTLPRGVECRRKNKRGKQLYGGMYCKRVGEKVRTIRSKRVWLTPGPAARWYQSQMSRLHRKRTEWAHNPDSVSYPVFPRYRFDFIPF